MNLAQTRQYKARLLETFEREAEKLQAFIADVAVLKMGHGWYVIQRGVGYSRCETAELAQDVTRVLRTHNRNRRATR